MAAPIGALLVELQANTAAFSADLKNMRRELSTHTQAMTKSLGSVETGLNMLTKGLGAVGLALSAVNLTQFAMDSLKAAAQLGDMAEQLGINVERLQEYRFAATQAGASVQDMDRALTRFATVLGDAQRGQVDAQSKLAELGIHWRTAAGGVRTVDEAWRDLADSIAREQDNTEALAKLADVLGERFGPNLLNSLREGSAGFDEAGRTAREWGAIISEEAVAKAKEFDDTLARLGVTLKAWAVEGVTAAPDLARQAFQPYIDYASRLLDIYTKLVANPLARVLSGGRFGTEPTPPPASTIPPGISPPLRILDDSPAAKPSEVRPPPLDPKALRQRADAIAAAEEMAAKDAAEAWEAFNQSLIKQEEERQARHRAMTEAIAKQEAMAAEDTQEAWDAFNEQQARLGREIEQIWEETRTPLERFNQRMERLNQLLEQGAIDWETYQRAVKKAQEDMERADEETEKARRNARELGLTFTSAMEDAIVAGEDWRDVLRGIVDDLKRILIRRYLTEPILEFFDVLAKGPKGGGGKTSGGGGIFDFVGKLPDIVLSAFASGTNSAPRGLALVGEDGPELVNFRGGEQVFDNATSMSMLGRADAGPTFFVDMRGASIEAVARLERFVERLNGSIEPRAVSAVRDAQMRGAMPR